LEKGRTPDSRLGVGEASLGEKSSFNVILEDREELPGPATRKASSHRGGRESGIKVGEKWSLPKGNLERNIKGEVVKREKKGGAEH